MHSFIFQELSVNHHIHWRKFMYGLEELDMLLSKMNNVYFGCSPQIFFNKTMRMNIERIPINWILPESVAPHISIKEVRIYDDSS
jgi:Tat protein secretion system quality control protein TatD with DNase activity